jgi:hypothetical protein
MTTYDIDAIRANSLLHPEIGLWQQSALSVPQHIYEVLSTPSRTTGDGTILTLGGDDYVTKPNETLFTFGTQHNDGWEPHEALVFEPNEWPIFAVVDLDLAATWAPSASSERYSVIGSAENQEQALMILRGFPEVRFAEVIGPNSTMWTHPDGSFLILVGAEAVLP